MAVEFDTMCGGFLFLGIFLGLLFLLATVLIIYYKQVSEGYEDQRRYQIMQQVGMSPGEVALSIRGADSAGIFPAAGGGGDAFGLCISHFGEGAAHFAFVQHELVCGLLTCHLRGICGGVHADLYGHGPDLL